MANNSSFSKIGYWDCFVSYMSAGPANKKGLSLSKAGDYNWYTIRYGNSHARTEVSFNTRNQTIRASIIIENNPSLYDKLKGQKDVFEQKANALGGVLQWDDHSKGRRINALLENQDVTDVFARHVQFRWFAEWAAFHKEIIENQTDVDNHNKTSMFPSIEDKKRFNEIIEPFDLESDVSWDDPFDSTISNDVQSESKPDDQTSGAGKVVESPSSAQKKASNYKLILEKVADFLGVMADVSLDLGRWDSSELKKRLWTIAHEALQETGYDSIISFMDAAEKEAVLGQNVFTPQEEARMDCLPCIFINGGDPIENAWSVNTLLGLMGGIENIVSILKILADHGWANASYYMGRCYGGLIGSRAKKRGKDWNRVEEWEIYAIKPNYKKALEYYEKAARAGYAPAELALGCALMSRRHYDKAESILRAAAGHGEKDAEILLKYLERYVGKVSSYENYRVEHYNEEYKFTQLGSNCIEYKGFLYYIDIPYDYSNSYDNKGLVSLVRMDFSGKKQTLLKFILNSQLLQFDPILSEQFFSITRDKIFLPVGKPDGIIRVDLDGSHPVYLKNLKANKEDEIITRAYAFDHFMVYQRGKASLYQYDYQTGESTFLLRYSGTITGISEKEIIINEKRVFKLDTHEQTDISRLYPALKGKTAEEIYLIDCAREIAYYRDNERRKIYGVTKQGEVVDVWCMPRVFHFLYSGGNDTLCFNGRRWTGKVAGKYACLDSYRFEVRFELPAKGEEDRLCLTLPEVILTFDRNGNSRIVYQGDVSNDSESRIAFGTPHGMTENMDLILWKKPKTTYEHWDCAFNPDKLEVFIFFRKYM